MEETSGPPLSLPEGRRIADLQVTEVLVNNVYLVGKEGAAFLLGERGQIGEFFQQCPEFVPC